MGAAALGPLALVSQAAGPIFGGFAAASEARQMRQQEQINAEWGKIRADQSDTAARVGLEEDLGAYRAAMSANGAGPSVATLGILDEVRKIRGRDRRIETGNRNREVFDARARARSYRPGMEIARGFARAGPSLFQLYGSLR